MSVLPNTGASGSDSYSERGGSMSESPRRTALYRLYNVDDRLLYLGITVNVRQRFCQHKMTKFWWHLVARKDVTWYPTREAALAAERTATVGERPIYDASYLAGNGPKYKTGPKASDPYWRPFAERLYREIEEGEYQSGERLPDESRLAAKYGISVSSVGRALDRLIACRMIERPSQRNYFNHIVRPAPDCRPIEAIQEPTPGEVWAAQNS